MAARVVSEDLPGEPHTVAGVDVTYSDGRARAGVVVLRFPELSVVDQATAEETVVAPYVPGLFSVRRPG